MFRLLPMWLLVTCLVLVAAGTAGLAIGFALAPLQTWLWLIVDFCIFTGIANAVVMWAVAFRIAQARWTSAINRLCHSAIFCVPISAVTLLALVSGVSIYAPWAGDATFGKSAWLNVWAFIGREMAGLAVLWVLLLLFVRWTLQADARTARGEPVTDSQHYRLNSIALACAMVYSLVSTIVAFDFIMSLSPRWISATFAPYYISTNLYTALAVIVLLSSAFRKPLGVEKHIGPQQFKDLGNLMLGFSLFSMGLFYAQYLTIWYENLPDETFFLIVRYLKGPWPPVGWASFIIAYGAPFVVLQSRYIKMRPPLLSGVAVLALLGFALERYLMVVPSIFPRNLMLFAPGVLGLPAFAAVFILCTAAFLGRYPAVSTADEALREIETREEVTV